MKQEFDIRKGRVTSMTRTYFLALAMLVTFVIGAFLSFKYAENEHNAAMYLLTTTGSLRAEIQEAVLLSNNLSLARCEGLEQRHCRAMLEDNLTTLRHLFRDLKTGGEQTEFSMSTNNSLRSAFLWGSPDLAARLDQFIANLQLILKSHTFSIEKNDPRLLHLNEQATGQLMADLDRLIVTHRYQVERRFQTFSVFHSLFFASTLLLLLGQAFLIFWPLFRSVKSQLTELTNVSAKLKYSNRKLEAMVKDRTLELDKARQDAVTANHSKSRFLAQAGHDMLQPIEAMSMLIQLLAREITSKRGQRLHHDMGNTLTSMTRLVRAVLDISKLEAGVIEPKTRTVSLDHFLPIIVQNLRPMAEKKNLDLRLVPSHLSIQTDPDLFERVLGNLLSNAIRYTQSGKVLIGIRRCNHSPEIWICDTGTGIPEDEFDRIFEEFTQLDDAHRDRSEGIGLGLSIVKRLCNLLGHDISLTSKQGQGTIFKIKLSNGKRQISNHDLAA